VDGPPAPRVLREQVVEVVEHLVVLVHLEELEILLAARERRRDGEPGEASVEELVQIEAVQPLQRRHEAELLELRIPADVPRALEQLRIEERIADRGVEVDLGAAKRREL